MRGIVERVLARAGHAMIWASTVDGARKQLRLEEGIGAVLLDVVLEGGRTGLEVLPHVPRGTPVFILSGHDEQTVREWARRYSLDVVSQFFRKGAPASDFLGPMVAGITALLGPN